MSESPLPTSVVYPGSAGSYTSEAAERLYPTIEATSAGSFADVFAAVREDVQTLCAAIAVIAVLAGSAFAGPIGVWFWCGVGGCAVGLVLAAVQFRQRRQ